jgi:hypothetical protein
VCELTGDKKEWFLISQREESLMGWQLREDIREKAVRQYTFLCTRWSLKCQNIKHILKMGANVKS